MADPLEEFPPLDEDEEVVVPAPPPPPPKRKSRASKWAERGLPADPEKAVTRLQVSRSKRKPKKIMVHHQVRVSKQTSDVVQDIAERYDVSIGAVLKKFVEDGVRSIAPDLIEKAGLQPTKPNPFDPMQAPPHPTFPVYEPTSYSYSYAPPVAPQEIDENFIAPSGGPPIPRGDS